MQCAESSWKGQARICVINANVRLTILQRWHLEFIPNLKQSEKGLSWREYMDRVNVTDGNIKVFLQKSIMMPPPPNKAVSWERIQSNFVFCGRRDSLLAAASLFFAWQEQLDLCCVLLPWARSCHVQLWARGSHGLKKKIICCVILSCWMFIRVTCGIETTVWFINRFFLIERIIVPTSAFQSHVPVMHGEDHELSHNRVVILIHPELGFLPPSLTLSLSHNNAYVNFRLGVILFCSATPSFFITSSLQSGLPIDN